MTGDDSPRTAGGDDRAVTVTDSIAAGTLVVLAVVLAAGLGLGVLFAPSGGTTNTTTANFTFKHFPDGSALVVTFSKGEPLPAGELAVVSGETNVTWATLANSSTSKEVSKGSTVQLTGTGRFGKPITTSTQVRIVWTGGNGTKVLDRWPADSGSG